MLHGVDLNAIIDEFVKGKPQDGFIKKMFRGEEGQRIDLLQRQSKGITVRDGVKSAFWMEVLRPHIERSIREGVGKLLRPTSLALSESEIKSTMAEIQSKLAIIGELRYAVDDGDNASVKLSRMRPNETKDK